MLRGLYSAANAMRYRAHEVEVIANNLANVNTDGFKSDRTAFRSFGDLLAYRLNDQTDKVDKIPVNPKPVGVINLGGPAAESPYIDFSPGIPKTTGNTLDLFLDGPGFFTVKTPEGPAYTRAGTFQFNEKGEIVTQTGLPLLSTTGTPIQITGTDPIKIGANGEITQGGTPIGVIDIAEFEDLSALEKIGGNLFDPVDPTVTPIRTQNTSVEQGSVEASNVDTVGSLVQLISAQRAYEAAARAVDMFGRNLEKVSGELGRLPG